MDITHGNVTVKLYETPVRVGKKRYPSWTVSWVGPDGRERKRFKDDGVALKWAEDKAKALDRGFTVAATAEEVASHRRADDIIKPTGKSMELVAHEYVELWKLTNKANTRAVGEFWAKHHIGDAAVTPAKAMEELLKAKRQDKLSDEYIHDLDVRLGKFAESFSMPLVDLTAPMLDDWLRQLPGSIRTRRNYRRALATLFHFARERRYLPRDWNELPKQGRVMAHDAPIEIYTPEELRRLLAAAIRSKGIKWSLVPFVAFGAFAGMRTAEIQRLDWSKVGEKYIEVSPKRTRTQSRRLVPILPPLSKWLESIAEDEGLVCRYKSLENHTAQLAENAGLEWKHNGLRHSFISYRVAQVQNVNQVALECGNSPQMIFQHYRERVTPEQAKEWFSITPQKVGRLLLAQS